jgi:hypothetical protein
VDECVEATAPARDLLTEHGAPTSRLICGICSGPGSLNPGRAAATRAASSGRAAKIFKIPDAASPTGDFEVLASVLSGLRRR